MDRRPTKTARFEQMLVLLLGMGPLLMSAKTAHASSSSAAQQSSGGAAATTDSSGSSWAEKRATRLSSEAMGGDFLSGRHALAEKKLREAIQICLLQRCSAATEGQLHRDLGVVYIAGMKHVEEGKDEFAAAFKADPAVRLAAPSQGSEVKQAFEEVKSAMKGSQPSPTEVSAMKPAETAKVVKADPGARTSEAAVSGRVAPESKTAAGESGISPSFGFRWRNWFSLDLMQDFVIHTKTAGVCGTSSDYKCFDAGRSQRVYEVGTYAPGGNQVSTAGLRPGTLRILLGYDRVLGRHLSLGARIGSVILGKAATAAEDSAFMYFHGEGRVTAWFGAGSLGRATARPYAFAAGGIAETDSKVSVKIDPYSQKCSETPCSFDAWKRSGQGFFGGGLGMMVELSKRGGPNAEIRYSQYLGPAVGSVALQLGYSLGF